MSFNSGSTPRFLRAPVSVQSIFLSIFFWVPFLHEKIQIAFMEKPNLDIETILFRGFYDITRIFCCEHFLSCGCCQLTIVCLLCNLGCPLFMVDDKVIKTELDSTTSPDYWPTNVAPPSIFQYLFTFPDNRHLEVFLNMQVPTFS